MFTFSWVVKGRLYVFILTTGKETVQLDSKSGHTDRILITVLLFGGNLAK